jgi:gamma-glutamylcyclotransferase (GGCT)/AIG2-like uncharacterized protein YtfP
MDPEQMNDRGVKFTERRPAKLSGHILKFNKVAAGSKAKKGEGKGNVAGSPEGFVEGALYTILEEGLEGLDRCEGYPEHYGKIMLRVKLDDGTMEEAWVYIAQPHMVAEGLRPTKEYLGHYLKGKDLLSTEYYQKLRDVETFDKWILIDTHIFDCIDADPAFRMALSERIGSGRLKLQITHIQRDEIEAMDEEKAEKRGRLLNLIDVLSVEMIPTKGAVYGTSKYGLATYDEGTDLDYLRNQSKKENPTRDALIFNTATLEEVDIFVSNDVRRVNRLKSVKPEITVMSFEEFKRFISSVT